jgi:N-acetylglucosaminyldiphosphoundecaprenol N-acetyl-beta-D-mannosaminyltransferase
MERIRQAVINNDKLFCAVGNVDMVMKCRRNPQLSRDFWEADMAIADGVPIVWAATLLGAPLRGRVAGTEIVWQCASVAAETGCSIAFVGGRPDIAEGAARNLADRYPGAVIHVLDTPFPLTPEASAHLAEEIRAKGAKIVLVALGAPRQERWVREYLAASGASVGIGIGSAFDIISGDKPWAPKWMRDHGLEWLFRLILEPRRLGRRYLLEDTPFIWHLLCAIFFRRVMRRPDTARPAV